MRRRTDGVVLVVEPDGKAGLELTDALRPFVPAIEWAVTLGQACSRVYLRPFRAVAVGDACSDDDVLAFVQRLRADGIALPVFALGYRPEWTVTISAFTLCSKRTDWRTAARLWARTLAADPSA